MVRVIVLVALVALPLPAAAQTGANAFGVTAAATAMEPAPQRREEAPVPELLQPARPQGEAQALASVAYRPGAEPVRKRQDEPLDVEIRPPEGYDEIEQFRLKGAKIAYARRF